MHRFVTSIAASISCATAIVTAGTVLAYPFGAIGLMVAGVAFVSVVVATFAVWSILPIDTWLGCLKAGAISTALAYPVGILLFAFAVQVAEWAGLDTFQSRSPTAPVFLSAVYMCLSFWILPGLVISTIVTIPVGIFASIAVHGARQQDRVVDRRREHTVKLSHRWQWGLTFAVVIICVVVIISRMKFEAPKRAHDVVIEKKAAETTGKPSPSPFQETDVDATTLEAK